MARGRKHYVNVWGEQIYVNHSALHLIFAHKASEGVVLLEFFRNGVEHPKKYTFDKKTSDHILDDWENYNEKY